MTLAARKSRERVPRGAEPASDSAKNIALEGFAMLVLTRKRSEMIRIGEDIVIKVIKTGNGTVKLGIEAPSHVRVLRAELTDGDEVAMHGPAAEKVPHPKHVAMGAMKHPVTHAPVGMNVTAVHAPSDQFPQPHVA